MPHKIILSNTPYWPRGLSAGTAAIYVGVSKTKFLREVREGIWPEPEKRGGRMVWDRHKIDEYWDSRNSGGMTLADAKRRAQEAVVASYG